MSSFDPIDVEYLQGLHVTDSILWLDAPRQADLCFLSHARAEPIGPQAKILVTEQTRKLLPHPVAPAKVLVCPYRRRFSLGQLDLELFPSGFMPGGAQLRVTRDKESLVYTSDFLLQPTRTTEPAEILTCDVLVIKASYGLPHQVFPPRDAVADSMIQWTERTFAQGKKPVFLTSPLGLAEEVAWILGHRGWVVRAHRSLFQLCAKYASLGVPIPNVRCFRGSWQADEVLLFPWHLRKTTALARLTDLCLGGVSGQAVEPNAHLNLNVDAAFPLSMHADHRSLIQYIKKSKARKVRLFGRAAAALAAELRRGGTNAWPMQVPEQLDLFKPLSAPEKRRPRKKPSPVKSV